MVKHCQNITIWQVIKRNLCDIGLNVTLKNNKRKVTILPRCKYLQDNGFDGKNKTTTFSVILFNTETRSDASLLQSSGGHKVLKSICYYLRDRTEIE